MKRLTKALVVLSGGQDSTTCLFWAKDRYDEVHAITFDYGQRHQIEIDAAIKVAEMAGVASHEVIAVPGILKSTSPLTSDAPLEQYFSPEQMAEVIGNRVELTFVPMRNMLFFTIAMNRAVALDCHSIVTGICEADNANYPDCTDSFRMMFEMAANRALGAKANTAEWFTIQAPLMYQSKAQTVKMARDLPGCWDALAYSHTSYDGKYPPTDMNHANVLRAQGFAEAGYPDPLVVRAVREGLMPVPETDNYEFVRMEEMDKAREAAEANTIAGGGAV